jgi:hypothetical protein
MGVHGYRREVIPIVQYFFKVNAVPGDTNLAAPMRRDWMHYVRHRVEQRTHVNDKHLDIMASILCSSTSPTNSMAVPRIRSRRTMCLTRIHPAAS